jgi:hypothetical protein
MSEASAEAVVNGAPPSRAVTAPKRKVVGKITVKTSPKPKAKASGKKKSSATVATKDRTGKKIRRAKAGGKGRLAAAKIYVMVVRVPEKLHARMWAKVKKAGTSLNALALSAIERAVK